jgi:hypothetical protein
MLLTQLERAKIDWEQPTFTLDVNQIALRPPDQLPPELYGLPQLEWNYFEEHKIELCVTPESSGEIAQGGNLATLGQQAFNRIQKTRLYKLRPSEVRLDLTDDEANRLWLGSRQMLFPTVADGALTLNQIHDVNQLVFHTISSGTLSNSAFVTNDGAFHRAKADIAAELSVTILGPGETWEQYQPTYNLVQPSAGDTQQLWQQQQELFQRIRSDTTGW